MAFPLGLLLNMFMAQLRLCYGFVAIWRMSTGFLLPFTELLAFFLITSVNLQLILQLCQPLIVVKWRIACSCSIFRPKNYGTNAQNNDYFRNFMPNPLYSQGYITQITSYITQITPYITQITSYITQITSYITQITSYMNNSSHLLHNSPPLHTSSLSCPAAQARYPPATTRDDQRRPETIWNDLKRPETIRDDQKD